MAQNARALTSRPDLRTEELDRMQQRADDLRSAIGRDVLALEARLRRAFDLRRQIARHPFVAAAVVLGGVLVATRIVQSVVRRVRTPEAGEARRRCSRKSRAIADSTGRRPGAREAHLKEARE